MAGYQYHGSKDTLQTALERRQRLQAELEETRRLHKEAQRINRESQRIEQRIIEMQNRTAAIIEHPHQALRKITPLPEPRYGGQAGLLAATAEITEHNLRKKHAA